MANSNSSNSKPQFPISITGHARTAKGDQQALANARTALDHLQAKRKRLAEEKEKNEAAKDQASANNVEALQEEEDDSSDDGTPGSVNEHLQGRRSSSDEELRAENERRFMKAREWVMRGGRNLSKKTGGKAEKDGGEGEGHSIVNTNLTGEVIGSDATGRGSDISSSEASDADEDEQQLAEKKKLNGDGDGHAVDEGSKERGVDDQAKKQKDMDVA